MTVALPASPPGQVQRRHEWPLVVLGAAGIFMMVANSRVRSLEAQAAGRLAGLVASGHTYVWGARHSFYWDLGRSTATGLTVTTECTSAFTLGPLLIAAGILFTWRRPPLPRMLKAVGLTAAVAITGNMARLTTVTWATDRYGNNGFNWSHIYAGTLLTIFTVIAALITLTRLALPKPTQQNKPAMPSTRSGGPASL